MSCAGLEKSKNKEVCFVFQLQIEKSVFHKYLKDRKKGECCGKIYNFLKVRKTVTVVKRILNERV